jgi:hypothetical protein
VKINQYCSVCKKHLDMEVIPTDDGGDDGVIWLRCPDCHGFLPKFTGEGLKPGPPAGTTSADTGAAGGAPPTGSSTSPTSHAGSAGAAAPPAARGLQAGPGVEDDAEAEDVDADAGATEGGQTADEEPGSAEPLAEYAARLAEADTTTARPYRPSSTYELNDVIHHLAYDDVGIVVAKEQLPGGRKAVKVFFDQAGLVHLIEQAPDGR